MISLAKNIRIADALIEMLKEIDHRYKTSSKIAALRYFFLCFNINADYDLVLILIILVHYPLHENSYSQFVVEWEDENA